ncbi:MAG: carbohydrate ABC transporter permease [Halanaerobiaceae bacterium]
MFEKIVETAKISGMKRILSKIKSSRKERSRFDILKRKRSFIGFLYALPAVLFLLLFKIWPLFFGLWISFWKWGFAPERFLGLGNYITIFTQDIIYTDPVFGLQIGDLGQSFLVTLYYSIGIVPVSIVLSFIIAYFLYYKFNDRLKGILRTVFFLPYITSQVAAIMVFKWIFHPNVGIANSVLTTIGIKAQQWLSDAEPIFSKILSLFGSNWPDFIPIELGGPSLALIIIMIFAIWSSIGFNILIFLAGLSNIPRELYDAAKVDGANAYHMIKHITLPLVSPMIFLLSIVSVIASFESFNAFYVFSNGEGSPMGTTMSLPLYIFRNFYDYGRVGYASALSVLLFLILLGLTIFQRKIAEKYVYYQEAG